MKRTYDAVITFLQRCMGLSQALELMLVDVIAALIPWLAPVIPAYMAFSHMTSVLAFPAWVATLGAMVVEFLGLSTVHTTFSFWRYNDEREARRIQHQQHGRGRRKALPRRAAGAPVLVAGITAGFYLAVIITVNVLLDDAGLVEKIAKALLSLLGTVAAVTLAIRAQHARRLAEAEERKLSRKENLSRKVPRKVSRKDFEDDWRKLPIEDKELMRNMSRDEIEQTYGVIRRTANNWYHKARR